MCGPGGQAYTECGSVCSSCRDLQMTKMDCAAQGECIAGCQCGTNQYKNDISGQCVFAADCTCYDAYDPENPIKIAGEVARQGCTFWYVFHQT